MHTFYDCILCNIYKFSKVYLINTDPEQETTEAPTDIKDAGNKEDASLEAVASTSKRYDSGNKDFSPAAVAQKNAHICLSSSR